MNKLALDSVHRELGATFTEEFGFSLPQSYETPEREVAYVRDAAGLFDQSYRGVLALEGPKVTNVLNGVLSSAVLKLSAGEGQTSCLLTPKGRVVGAFFLHCVDDGACRLIAREPMREALSTGIRKYVALSDISVRDATPDVATLVVQGPAAGSALGRFSGGTPPAALRGLVQTVEIAGARCGMTAGGATPEGGFELYVPTSDLEAIFRSVHRAVADVGGGIAGHAAAEELRVEAGQVSYGRDWDEESFPNEIGWDHALTYDKCYVGQEVVARMRTYGEVNRKIRGLVLDGDRPVQAGSVVRAGDDEAGRVTSCVRSARLKCVLALARIKRKHWDAASVTVEDAGGPAGPRSVEARQVELPFVRLDEATRT